MVGYVAVMLWCDSFASALPRRPPGLLPPRNAISAAAGGCAGRLALKMDARSITGVLGSVMGIALGDLFTAVAGTAAFDSNTGVATGNSSTVPE